MPEPEPIRSTHAVRPRTAEAAPRVRLLSLGEFTSRRAFAWRRHQHLEFEAIIPVRGRYRCRIGEVEVAAMPGSVLMVKPFDWHEDQLAPGVRYWALRFALADDSLRTAGGWFRAGLPATRQVCPRPDGALHLLRRIGRESARADAVAPLVQDALAGEFVWNLARSFVRGDLAPGLFGGDGTGSFQRRLERWFEARVEGRVAVGDIARAMGLGRTALTAACLRHFGVPPARAFRNFKLERARELLQRTGMSVTEVADQLGYGNPFHFSRAFKSRWGRPPSETKRSG